ncbi:hypothetical protein CD30_09320 [Ureibacillus massiliensis 4400831 = CIP 108448 = CCUG 49529]|uniref:Lysozyme inhibitor LprI-like N-terminal domain-containing protein n=1 Tax=Ureibacillus massiliensis 4400831 = CIP 108448 = CCUG 49529 TaxID=1211035 RepID=A0A0A3J1L0_9BACL|nr:lysozyme inhibitor LprI family protein [Ureibacillus massiliensis]KGR90894.1 hypothetical protein CD30_09320 [Ureibacillus massiliensis 4400831 = CIP 108448 = CCUG 49529]
MKNNRKFLIVGMLTVVLALAACTDSVEESSVALDNEVQNDSNTNLTDRDSASKNTDSIETNNTDTYEQPDTQNIVPNEKDSSSNNTESLKAAYVKKLNDTKIEMEEMRNNPISSSTYALKEIENEIYIVWDSLLNEIYGVLQQQLPKEEMDKLREEQRDWITYRDNSALEASQKYKGGTQEHLEYDIVRNDRTEERCFELVKNYMK